MSVLLSLMVACTPPASKNWEQPRGRFVIRLTVVPGTDEATLSLVDERKRVRWRRPVSPVWPEQLFLDEPRARLVLVRPTRGTLEVLGPGSAPPDVISLEKHLTAAERALLPRSTCGTAWVAEVSVAGDVLTLLVPQDGNLDLSDDEKRRRMLELKVELPTLTVRRAATK